MTPEVDQLYKAYTEGYSVGIQLGPMGRTIELDRLVMKAKKKAACRYKMYHLRAWHTGFSKGVAAWCLKEVLDGEPS